MSLLLAFAYGGYRRQIRTQTEAHDASMPKGVSPATASANEVKKDIPIGNASLVRSDPNQLQPPVGENAAGFVQSGPNASCGFDPHTGQAYRFNPETGQPCPVSSQDRVVVRQPGYAQTQPAPTAPEPTPEERRVAAAYQREREAMSAPTGIRSGGAAGSFSLGSGGIRPFSAGDDLAQVAALTQAIAGQNPTGPAAAALTRPALLPGSVAKTGCPRDRCVDCWAIEPGCRFMSF
jgi:hypothetical protein